MGIIYGLLDKVVDYDTEMCKHGRHEYMKFKNVVSFNHICSISCNTWWHMINSF